MKRFLAGGLLFCIGAVVLFLLADMVHIGLTYERIVDSLMGSNVFAPSDAVLAHTEAITVLLAVGVLVLFRTSLYRIGAALLDRVAGHLAQRAEEAGRHDARPAALVTSMLLVLGVFPILIYVVSHDFFHYGDFFVWPMVQGGWLIVSAIILAGLVKRHSWAYYALIGLCVANLLLSAGLALQCWWRLGQPFYGPHGFGALAELGVMIGLVLFVMYLGVSVFLTVYLWRKRRCLAPPVSDRQHDPEVGGSGTSS